MEENVALDTTKQRKFVKSIKGIKKLIKKNENEKTEESIISPKKKSEKRKSKRPERGLVYLSHIPHGFYEHEMTQYFKQFGVVTNARVIRSKRTGNSKGFAFVEFKEPAVAEIVAETMNNYLMGKRLIKAAYVPPEKQRPKAMRKHWSRLNNPGRDARMKLKKSYNANKDDEGDLKRARKILSNINKTKKKLSELGINYDFFTPVDVPEALQDSLKGKENNENNIEESTVKDEKKTKKNKKVQNVESKDTKDSKDTAESLKKEKSVSKDNNKPKSEKNKKVVKAEVKKESVVRSEGKKPVDIKKEIKAEVPVVNKKEQKKKQLKLKDAGVNPPENFIKVLENSEDSDSSFEFDSDEYEKMLQDDDSDVDSGDDSEGDEDNGADSNEDTDDADIEEDDESNTELEEEIIQPPKKSKGKPAPIVAKPQKQAHKENQQEPEKVKRKVPQKSPVALKKPKFEKQTQQSMKKQFKKKK